MTGNGYGWVGESLYESWRKLVYARVLWMRLRCGRMGSLVSRLGICLLSFPLGSALTLHVLDHWFAQWTSRCMICNWSSTSNTNSPVPGPDGLFSCPSTDRHLLKSTSPSCSPPSSFMTRMALQHTLPLWAIVPLTLYLSDFPPTRLTTCRHLKPPLEEVQIDEN